MAPILCVHVGQAGVQIGNALWELFCLEHGIRPNGHMGQGFQDCVEYNALFEVSRTGIAMARAVMVDLEPSVIDEVRSGAYRCLFSPNLLLTGKEDAAGTFARGYYNIGREMIEITLDRIRRAAEISPDLQGILIFRSFGGGTGSGFTALLLERLSNDFEKKCKYLFSVYPSPKFSSVIVEPYNAILTTHACMNYEDCSFLIDNEACYDILNLLHVPEPSYTNINRLIAQVISAAIGSLRFEGPQILNITEFQTNLVPQPRLHYPIMSYAPLVGKCMGSHQMTTTKNLTTDCFQASNQLVKCDLRKGKFLACCLAFRGDVAPSDVNYSIKQIKADKTIKFVEWSPTTFKVAINYHPPACVPGGDLAPATRNACLVCNNTAIKEAWSRLMHKFKLLYKKRAFVHHFVGEGMEESEFKEAEKNVTSLIHAYVEAEK